MLERLVLVVFKNIRWNPTTLNSTSLSRLWLILSQFSKLMDQTNYRKLFYDVFPRYLELIMLEHHVLGVVENFIRNPTTLISTSLSQLWLIPSKILKLVDWTDCHKLLFDAFPRYLELLMLERRVLGVVGNVRWNPMTLLFILTYHNYS